MSAIDAERCIGCGALSLRHPMVAVGLDTQADRMRAYPVCETCWTHPEHRTTQIKGHFFTRSQERVAVAMAGSSQIGG